MKATKVQIQHYLIDVIGLDIEDVEGLSKEELLLEVERPSELKAYCY